MFLFISVNKIWSFVVAKVWNKLIWIKIIKLPQQWCFFLLQRDRLRILRIRYSSDEQFSDPALYRRICSFIHAFITNAIKETLRKRSRSSEMDLLKMWKYIRATDPSKMTNFKAMCLKTSIVPLIPSYLTDQLIWR